MDNSKKLTPEEIDAIAEAKALKHADRHYPPDSDLINTNEFGMRRVFCLSNLKDGYLAAAQEITEKDALLKEAIRLLKQHYNGTGDFMDGFNLMNETSAFITRLKTAPGKDTGK